MVPRPFGFPSLMSGRLETVRLASVVLLAGCSYTPRGGPGTTDAPTDDGMTGDATDAPDAPIDATGFCLGAAPFTVCTMTPPMGNIGFNFTGTIDTDLCPSIAGLAAQKVPQANGPMLCVLSGMTVSFNGGTLTGQGSLPLALFASGDLTIQGGATIDVSGEAVGAGGSFAGCGVPAAGADDGNGGGGGAGGSFGTNGGNGTSVSGAGAGGTATAGAVPTFLRGGCNGGKGGDANGSIGGAGGRGGGAVYLLAGGTLTINGKLNASGSGGLATNVLGRGAGGGGGSGGMIAVFGAGGITIAGGAQLWANGGGGGGGSDGTGNEGGDGMQALNPNVNGLGGTQGASGATAGGNGAKATELGAAGGGGADKSGGGGGGGVGWIENVSGGALANGSISPPAM